MGFFEWFCADIYSPAFYQYIEDILSFCQSPHHHPHAGPAGFLSIQYESIYAAWRAGFPNSRFDHLAPNAVVLAPWEVSQPIRYFQFVENVRPDLLVVNVSPNMPGWVDIPLLAVLGVIGCAGMLFLVAWLHEAGRNFALLWFAVGIAHFIYYCHHRKKPLV